MPAPISCAPSPTSRGASSKTRCARPSSKIFFSAGSAKRDLPEFYQAIKAIGLGAADAATIVDVTACPGTDTCKLGIASSRGLARELRQRLGEKSLQLDEAVKNLRIKVSGCFNSCGQHHIADIGFYGINRNVKGFQVPHFQVILGGKFHDNAGEYGVPIGAVPSKRIPEAVTSITEFYVRAAVERRALPGSSSRASARRRSRICSKI